MRGLKYFSIRHVGGPATSKGSTLKPIDDMTFDECLMSLGFIEFRDMPCAMRKLFYDLAHRIEALEGRDSGGG